MTTISFEEPIEIPKKHFKNIEEFQLYIVNKLQETGLSPYHKSILDARLSDVNENPESYLTRDEWKASKRK